MEVVSIRPKGVYVNFEMEIQEVDALRRGIALSKIEYDGKDPKELEAKTMVENFWQLLDDVCEDIKKNGS